MWTHSPQGPGYLGSAGVLAACSRVFAVRVESGHSGRDEGASPGLRLSLARVLLCRPALDQHERAFPGELVKVPILMQWVRAGPRVCISELPRDTDAAGPCTTLYALAEPITLGVHSMLLMPVYLSGLGSLWRATWVYTSRCHCPAWGLAEGTLLHGSPH